MADRLPLLATVILMTFCLFCPYFLYRQPRISEYYITILIIVSTGTNLTHLRENVAGCSRMQWPTYAAISRTLTTEERPPFTDGHPVTGNRERPRAP